MIDNRDWGTDVEPAIGHGLVTQKCFSRLLTYETFRPQNNEEMDNILKKTNRKKTDLWQHSKEGGDHGQTYAFFVLSHLPVCIHNSMEHSKSSRFAI